MRSSGSPTPTAWTTPPTTPPASPTGTASAPRSSWPLLWFAETRPWGDGLRLGLPTGGQGTLEGRLVGVKVRAKTGTLIDISALSGWVWMTKESAWGEFSIMSRRMSKSDAVAIEDRIVRIVTNRASARPAVALPSSAEQVHAPGVVTGSELDTIVRATPASRDRAMDFLRAASIVAVVCGHWLISINHWEGGVIRSTSAIGVTPGLWLFTWVFQVMPIFFFVGGFSNLVAYDSARRKGESTQTFIRGRLERLLRPSIVFLGLWAIVQVMLHLADVGAPTGPRLWGDTTLLRGMKPPGATIPFGPLWFLGVYLVVVVIAPVTIRLHRRFGLWVPVAMASGRRSSISWRSRPASGAGAG